MTITYVTAKLLEGLDFANNLLREWKLPLMTLKEMMLHGEEFEYIYEYECPHCGDIPSSVWGPHCPYCSD